MKIFLNAVGILAVVLGIVGIFLPLLPTTPFILLAAACFARGSERLHARLLANRWCGKLLRDYEQGKGIPARAKVLAMLMMWSSLAFVMWRHEVLWLRIALFGVGAGVSWYLLRLPTARRA